MMKKSMALAAASIALLAATQAQAQFAYTQGDLMLNFREVNGAAQGAFNVTLNLGNAATFASANASSVLQINQFESSWLTGATASGNAGFGDLNNVRWSSTASLAAAGQGADNNHIWASRARTSNLSNDGSTAGVAGSTAWLRRSESQQGPAGQRIHSVGVGANSIGADFGVDATRTDSSQASSYLGQAGTTGAYNVGGATVFFGSNSTEANTGTLTGSSFLDLYDSAFGSGNSTYLGYFELQADGDLFFYGAQYSSVIPEPTTYAMLSGLGLLALALRRNFRKTNA